MSGPATSYHPNLNSIFKQAGWRPDWSPIARIQRGFIFLSITLLVSEVAGMVFIARIGRAQLHRARSASKKGTWLLPLHPPEAARCVGAGD